MTRCVPNRFCSGIYLFALLMALGPAIDAQEPEIVANKSVPDVIAAWVGESPIPASRVEAHLKATLGERKLSESARMVAQASSLQHLIRRRILFDYLEQKKFAPTDDQIDLEIEGLEKKLSQIDRSLKQHLEETGQAIEQVRFEFGWKLAWAAFLKRFLTDANLERHFERNRRRFDGTKMHVAHLLLKTDGDVDLLERAGEIRQQIVEGQLTWDAAVKKFSNAPSRETGGEVGWIAFSGPMPDAFTIPAFELEQDEISEPVTTRVGVHLIKCLEVQPGSLGWKDARPEVRQHATEFLFDKLSSEHRAGVEVRYNEAYPHFSEDENGELILKTPPAKK